MKKLVILAIACIFITAVGCSSTKVDSGGGSATQAPQGQMTGPVSNNQPEVNPLKDPNNILYKRSAYFDFDKYEVKSNYQSIIAAHAKYLKDHPQAMIEIQGNCDERGSKQYNQKLGLKRAIAVKQMMSSLGVSDKQVSVISFGKDKPDAKGHDEQAWAQNRRADIVYAGEKRSSDRSVSFNEQSPVKFAFIEK